MSKPVERTSLRVVPLLLALQAASVYFLWSLNPSGQSDQTAFALFLAVTLVSLSMISYVFRVERWGNVVNRALLLVGCLVLLVLLFAGLFV